MSQSHEPSYYEIALTNRQVLVVFVVLLICVVASFFSGVWIGRRATSATVEGEVAELEPEEKGEEPELRKLRFFADESGRDEERDAEAPPLAEIAEEPRVATTLLEDVSGQRSGSDATAGGAASGEATGEPSAGGTASREPSSRSAVSTAKPEPASGHVVQVFSSTDETQARRLVQRLAGGGFPAFISPFKDRGQVKYRVRVGPYQERSRADEAAGRLRREFRLDTWVTQLP